MNYKSTFDSLLQVKRKLKESISKQWIYLDFISNACINDIQDSIDEARETSLNEENEKIVLLNGECAQILSEGNSPYFTVKLWASDTPDDYEEVSIQFDNQQHDIELNLNTPLIEGYQTSLGDIIDSLDKGAAMNEAISDVNDQFLESVQVPYQSIKESVNRYSGTVRGDAETLLDMVKESCIDGKLSNYSWVNILNLICKDSKKNIDDEQSIELVYEAFYAIQSFMSTVLDTIGQTFQIILYALAGVFAALMAVLYLVINFVSQIIGNFTSSDFILHEDASYPGIYGTFRADKIGNDKVYYVSNDSRTLNKMYRLLVGSEDVYFYTTKESDDSYATYMENKIYLFYHPFRTIAYLHGLMDHITNDGYNTCEFFVKKAFTPWDFSGDESENPALTADEYELLKTDRTFLKRTIWVNMFMLFIQRIVFFSNQQAIDDVFHSQLGIFTTKTWNLDSYAGSIWPIDNSHYFTLPLQMIGSAILQYHNRLSTFETQWGLALDYMDANWIPGYIEEFRSITTNDTDTSVTLQYENVQIGQVFGCVVYPSIFGHKIDKIISSYNGNDIIIAEEYETMYQAQCIPGKNLISFPSVTPAQILLSLITATAIFAAATLTAKVISSKFKARKQTRQAARVQRLNSLRDDWNEDPGNKEKKKAYSKALSSYNLKASIFKWGSYDAVNGWVNDVNETTDNQSIVNNITSLANSSSLDSVSKLIKGS